MSIIEDQEKKLKITLDNANARRDEIEKEVERAELILKDVYTTLVNMTKFVNEKIDK